MNNKLAASCGNQAATTDVDWRAMVKHAAFGLVGLVIAMAVQTAAAEPMSTLVLTSTPITGTLVEAQFNSPTLGRAEPYRVYLPPDYATSDRRYPVLYMLHGAGGNYTEWTDSFLPERADEMIARGTIQPMIVVMPEGGSRTYWANWPGGLRWADYLAYDVVGEIDSHFRTLPTPASRAVGGLSMGGLGALHTALHHPEIFGVVGGHSPSMRLEPDSRVADSLMGDTFYEYSPIWLVQHRWQPGEHLNIWVDVGLDDGWRPNIEAFGAALQSQGVASTWREFPGTHEDTYWTSHVSDYLSFYSSALISSDGAA
jgi:enterochelin esterase-like enzyme